ncbi:FimV/HubP family polar landmark protein [Methylobacillus sp. Pita1]|uniref:FimV/HubP family polar landmark protein n=1 Tax=Methylobacillus sp. Pita1 TaxID=3382642 RepID=UPI0038B53091
MHKSKLKGVALAMLLAFAPMVGEAAGLGRLTVTSGLGEPLSAEIELLSTTPDELATLTAGIAPQEAYNVQGVERTAIHNAIKVDVSKRADGAPVLKLTSSQAISDPFLDMLIQVDWATGRLLREYTVLLDPPGYNNQAQVYNGVQLPPSAAPAMPAPAATPAQTPPPASTATQRPPAPTQTPARAAPEPVAPAQSSASQSYTTASGDTLSAIAREHQVQGVSLDQMLVGLYRANEDAFAGKNMNRLKVGQILRVPSASELQQLTPAEATREVRVQTADWNAYRNRLADLAAESAPSTDGGAQQSASGRISSPATDRAAPPADASRDVVRLSSNNASQAQLNAIQEELTAKDKSLKEAAERAAMLEKQIADMQKLLAIKNQALANLQNGDAPPAKPEETLAPPPVETPEPQPEPETAAPAAEPSAQEPATDAAPAGDEAEPVKPEPQPAPAPVPAVAEEPSLFDELVGDDPLPLALAAGGIVLLLGGWLYMRNKRKRELDSFERGIQTAGGLKPNTVFGNTTGATVNTGDTSFLNDFSQNTGGMIDTHDVDPIAEAEVYMAYGRDAQAEEILKDAIVKEPQRHELHLKLLEIYAARNDTSAFETVAGEIYTTLGAADPIWSKVAAMGRKLEPDNPLYSEDNIAERPASLPAQETPQAGKPEQQAAQDHQAAFTSAALAGAAVATGASLLGEKDAQDSVVDDAPFAGADDSQAEERDLPALDFDLDAASLESAKDADADAAEQHAGNSMDFSLDLPEPPAKNSLQLDIAELDAAIPDFDLPELPGNETDEDAVTEPDADAVPEFFIPELDDADSQQQPVDSPLQTPDVDLGLPEIALPEIELPNPAAESTAEGEDLQDDGLPDIDFDLPEISFAEEPASKEAETEAGGDLSELLGNGPDVPESTLEVDGPQDDAAPSFDFAEIDLDSDELNSGVSATAAPSQKEEIVLPDFDLDIEEDEPSQATTADIDLSGISLDVAGDSTEAESLAPDGEVEESADVDTKLDLVTAYMDMGDNEGARELLEEILKEGGPRQKQKAQSILDSLA